MAEHPLRERLWGQLALAQYRARRQADAVRTLATARTTLGEELGLDPGPDLQRLERQILNQDLALPSCRRGSRSGRRPRRRAAVAGPAVVGRDHEQQQLREGPATAVGGPSRLLLVDGEAGIGKTTMLDASPPRRPPAAGASRWAAASRAGWPRRCGRGSRSSARSCRAATAARRRSTGRQLAALLPGAATEAENLSPVELADHIAELLRHDVAGGPRLLVLDDLHWADATSLELLTLVVARLPDTAAAGGVGPPTARPGDRVAVRPCPRRARPPPVAQPRRLAGLAADDVARLMTIVSGAEPTPEVAARVRDRTGGNPFFVGELARLAGVARPGRRRRRADGRARRRAPPPGPAAAGRLEVLAVAAVLGEDIDLRLLAAASGDCSTRPSTTSTRRSSPASSSPATGARSASPTPSCATPCWPSSRPLRLARIHKRAADAIEAVHGADPDHAEPIASHRRPRSPSTTRPWSPPPSCWAAMSPAAGPRSIERRS